MCGIVGYIGHRNVSDFLIEGLNRLEYRGYDSAGVAAFDAEGTINLRKRAGRVCELSEALDADPVEGTVGIGHPRFFS